jgi:exodeoxyribonuclease VII large subunit
MARRPFDPSQALGGEGGGLFDQPGPPPEARGSTEPSASESPATEPEPTRAAIGVAELGRRISEALQRLPQRILVVGQIANLRRSNGHLYFTLREEGATIGSVMWSSLARRLGELPAEGDEVEVLAQVVHYPPAGRTQLQVFEIRPRGLGALEMAFRRLCEELRGLGWFEEGRKAALPLFPRRIAVVTAEGSAALADCLRTAALRCPAVALLVVPVRVQGQEAASEVARAVAAIDACAAALQVDAICVTRGGGSIEDLAAFNDRSLAEAVFRCRTPIVAAIGHESDQSVVELVADRRASTPTAAVMLLLPDRVALGRDLGRLSQRLRRLLAARLSEAAFRLQAAAQHRFLRRPSERLALERRELGDRIRRLGAALRGAASQRRHELLRRRERLRFSLRLPSRERLSLLAARLERAGAEAIRRRSLAVDAAAARLRGVGPAEVLARGYAIPLEGSGGLLRSVADAPAGREIRLAMADGWLDATSRGGRRGDPLGGDGGGGSNPPPPVESAP